MDLQDCSECERTIVDGETMLSCFQCDCDEYATDSDCMVSPNGDTCVIEENQLCGICQPNEDGGGKGKGGKGKGGKGKGGKGKGGG
jgi:hypothetical protein